MRSRIEELPAGIVVTLPIQRSTYSMIAIPVWLGLWAYAAIQAQRQVAALSLQQAGNRLQLFLLAIWFLAGAWFVLSLFWMLLGRERMVFSEGSVLVQQTLLGLGRRREFDLQQVTEWRVSPALIGGRSAASVTMFGLGSSGAISFDYGARTIRLGAGLDEAEARMVLGQLASRHAIAAPTAAA
jgi:hypothetical protein